MAEKHTTTATPTLIMSPVVSEHNKTNICHLSDLWLKLNTPVCHQALSTNPAARSQPCCVWSLKWTSRDAFTDHSGSLLVKIRSLGMSWDTEWRHLTLSGKKKNQRQRRVEGLRRMTDCWRQQLMVSPDLDHQIRWPSNLTVNISTLDQRFHQPLFLLLIVRL